MRSVAGVIARTGVDVPVRRQLEVEARVERRAHARLAEVELADARHVEVGGREEPQVHAHAEVRVDDEVRQEVPLRREHRRQVRGGADLGAAEGDVVRLRIGEDQLGGEVLGEEVGEVDLGDQLVADLVASAGTLSAGMASDLLAVRM
jgi:hypothetical protein